MSDMDKSVMPAPLGLDALQEDTPDEMEITIVDDEGGEDMPDAEGPSEEEANLQKAMQFDVNLAEVMPDDVLDKLTNDLLEDVDADIASREDWVETYIKGLDVLGLKYEERTEPWDGACGTYSTVLTEAVIRFQADTITETFPAKGPVKAKLLGAATKEKEAAAKRVEDDMNYQLTEVMTEYRPEHERLLFNLGLAGAAFKKVYYDKSKRRQTAVFVPAEDFIMPFGAPSAQDSERCTHVMRLTPNQMQRMMATGDYRYLDLGDPVTMMSDMEEKRKKDEGYSIVDDDRYTAYEVVVNRVFDDWQDPLDPISMPEGNDPDERLPLPYVVTIEAGTRNILSVRRNWKQGDKTCQRRMYYVQYTYVPGMGSYGLGLVHIVGGYARSGTALIRQLVDAGTLSNLPGGMKTRGMRVKGDDTPIAPGEFRDVDVPSGTLKDNIMPLPYKEPSATLITLLDKITEDGRRLGAIADMDMADVGANAPVGTTLALLERQMKTMSAVQARVHFSLTQELKLLKDIIADNAPEDYDYDPDTGTPQVRKSDYRMVTVIPVSDPNASTMSQRLLQYQAAMGMAKDAPQIYNLPFLHRQMLEVIGIPHADKIVVIDEDQNPRDPVSENMGILTGKPVKAFIAQDHDAHMSVHQSMMADPLVQATIGQNPMAQQIQGALMAHVMEHMAFKYRLQMQQQLGATLPMPNTELAPEVEALLSQMLAQAGQQVLAQNKAQAAQQQAQQMQQDPAFQLQVREVAAKEAKVANERAKVDNDNRNTQDKLVIEAQKVGVMGRSQDSGVLAEDRQAAAVLEAQIEAEQQQREQTAQQAQSAQQMAAQGQQAQQAMAIKQANHEQDLQHGQQTAQQALAAELQKTVALQAVQPQQPPQGGLE